MCRRIRHQIAKWLAHGDEGFVRIGGLSHLNPVTLIRRCLVQCLDEAPTPGTTELTFLVGDEELRQSIRLDISAANRDLVNGEWKGATVLAGSAVEALLLWILQRHEAEHQGALAAASATLVGNETIDHQPHANPERWVLHEYIEVRGADRRRRPLNHQEEG